MAAGSWEVRHCRKLGEVALDAPCPNTRDSGKEIELDFVLTNLKKSSTRRFM